MESAGIAAMPSLAFFAVLALGSPPPEVRFFGAMVTWPNAGRLKKSEVGKC